MASHVISKLMEMESLGKGHRHSLDCLLFPATAWDFKVYKIWKETSKMSYWSSHSEVPLFMLYREGRFLPELQRQRLERIITIAGSLGRQGREPGKAYQNTTAHKTGRPPWPLWLTGQCRPRPSTTVIFFPFRFEKPGCRWGPPSLMAQ